MDTVAFYGAGMLASGFIQNMRRQNTAVRVWNRTPHKAKALERFGAEAFESPVEAARGADRVHLCLRDDRSVDSTLEAALPGITAGVPVIDHTTVSPAGVPVREQRLRDAGIPFLHAPVFMGPVQAADGTGLMLTSGDRERVEHVRAALEAMTGKLWYLGDRVQQAAIFKLMGNSMILAIVGGLRDMFTIGEANGVDRREAYALFDKFDPSGQIRGRGKRMVEHDHEPAWTLDMARKDASLMLESAGDRELHVIAAVERAMREAVERGLEARDLAAIAG